MGAFEDKVRGVLSDTMNLPSDFLGMIPQYVAQNPVSLARTSGTRITSAQVTSNVTATGTTFGTGTDVLSSPLTFTADGKTDYVVTISARTWNNAAATTANVLNINLDGADAGAFGQGSFAAANAGPNLHARGVIVKPSAGSHTVNVRFVVSAATAGFIAGGVGGVGGDSPILVTLEVA